MVVDLSGTVYCDLAGLQELEVAHERAVADGGGLRLVTPAGGAFLRIFTVTGCVIPAFGTVQEALAQAPTSRPAPGAMVPPGNRQPYQPHRPACQRMPGSAGPGRRRPPLCGMRRGIRPGP